MSASKAVVRSVDARAEWERALAAAKLPPDCIVEWFGKPVDQLDDEERREAARTIAEAS